jgi:hypothetical protein
MFVSWRRHYYAPSRYAAHTYARRAGWSWIELSSSRDFMLPRLAGHGALKATRKG